jgi:hypothetical protein
VAELAHSSADRRRKSIGWSARQPAQSRFGAYSTLSLRAVAYQRWPNTGLLTEPLRSAKRGCQCPPWLLMRSPRPKKCCWRRFLRRNGEGKDGMLRCLQPVAPDAFVPERLERRALAQRSAGIKSEPIVIPGTLVYSATRAPHGRTGWGRQLRYFSCGSCGDGTRIRGVRTM